MAHTAASASYIDPLHWTPQPQAAALVEVLLGEFCDRCPDAVYLGRRMHAETGTRLIDWVDHLSVAEGALSAWLPGAGFYRAAAAEADTARAASRWEHPLGLFPPIYVREDGKPCCGLALKVESVADFLTAHRLPAVEIEGRPLAQLRKARIFSGYGAEMWVVERHGYTGLDAPDISADQVAAVLWFSEQFRRRQRIFADDVQGFEHAEKLFREAAAELGGDWACDLFFAAERDYWQRRNLAAGIQKARQDALGLGWANHDHHTYRSSRRCFPHLIGAFEAMGFVLRERFYGGREAGWGAQIVEQPACGVVIFADVDLSPEEVSGDFAHEPLPPREKLGTVGLWCKLHGEAFLQAGMHHLECRFDFDAARQQLLEAGIPSMKPFTNFPHLKQAFTQGQMWPVDEARLQAALSESAITPQQAEQFRTAGALGSHLEILQRDEGYKGFNQTGISEIIQHTDPRRNA